MTKFRNFKNQSAFYNHHVLQINIKQLKQFFKAQCTILNYKKIRVYYNRQKIALSVLDAVRNRFPETNEFIDSTLTEECEKERITVDEVLILYKITSKTLAWINIFCF